MSAQSNFLKSLKEQRDAILEFAARGAHGHFPSWRQDLSDLESIIQRIERPLAPAPAVQLAAIPLATIVALGPADEVLFRASVFESPAATIAFTPPNGPTVTVTIGDAPAVAPVPVPAPAPVAAAAPPRTRAAHAAANRSVANPARSRGNAVAGPSRSHAQSPPRSNRCSIRAQRGYRDLTTMDASPPPVVDTRTSNRGPIRAQEAYRDLTTMDADVVAPAPSAAHTAPTPAPASIPAPAPAPAPVAPVPAVAPPPSRRPLTRTYAFNTIDYRGQPALRLPSRQDFARQRAIDEDTGSRAGLGSASAAAHIVPRRETRSSTRAASSEAKPEEDEDEEEEEEIGELVSESPSPRKRSRDPEDDDVDNESLASSEEAQSGSPTPSKKRKVLRR